MEESFDTHELVESIVVSKEALSLMAYDTLENEDESIFITQLTVDEMQDEDPQLYEGLQMLLEGWELSRTEKEAFSEGFVYTFNLVRIESRANRTEVPELSGYIALGFITKLGIDSNSSEYFHKSLEQINEQNEFLVQAWQKYVDMKKNEYDDDSVGAFILGGVMAHDLLRDQVNVRDIIKDFGSLVN